jgi:hypothetical protein
VEEVIDAIRENAIEQSIPLDLPTDDDLVIIEEQILMPLPYSFKQFLLTVSDVVLGSLEPVTASDPYLHTYLPEVTAQAWADGLSRELIPICQVGSDYYCINQNAEVMFWVNGELEDEHWESIWRWAQDVWLES